MALRPGIEELTGDNDFAQLARDSWLTTTANPPKVLSSTVSKLWKLLEDSDFSPFNLLLLEQLQALERYLWPGFTDAASNQHILLLVLLVTTKRQEQLPVWAAFESRPEEFADFFRRVTHLSIDRSLATPLRTYILEFLVAAFQSLDQGIVRKECAPLLSIGIWQNLHSDVARERLLAKNAQLQKAWRAAGKKYDGADAAGQARLRFERSWLNTLLLDFLDRLYDTAASKTKQAENALYCERVLELLCDLQSQLPTRRYVNTLLKDLNVLQVVVLSPRCEDDNGVKDMSGLLSHYTYFPVDDQTGRQLSRQEFEEAQNANISRLQKVAMKLQPEKLKILMLANFGLLSKREELHGQLVDLSDAELIDVCRAMGVRTTEYPEKSLLTRDRAFLLETLIVLVESKPHYTNGLRKMPILPTEQTLYSPALTSIETYDGTRPLAIPKLNLQYLTIGDFLWRSFTLYRYESLFEIRSHLQDTIKRLQPRRSAGVTRFNGFSRMAIPIPKPAIIESLPPKVGETVPAEVKVEIILDVSRLQPGLRREWEGLKSDDTVFLVALHPPEMAPPATNGSSSKRPYNEQVGLKTVRCAEVISMLDENSRVLRRPQDSQDDTARPKQRRLLLKLDAAAYAADKKRADEGKADVYEDINLVIRRKGRENNFRPVLESIRQLALSDTPVPTWLQDVLLGYGDPSSATYKRLSNRLKSIDYRDTFLDWQHLIESLPGKTIEPDPTQDGSFRPPYVLEATDVAPTPTAPKGKKRRRDQPDGPDPSPGAEMVKVSTYTPPNTGPYPTDTPKLNTIRFTPTQIEAITSGTQPGLTVIVGPPGTGKTDVATQIINNIYHQFPQQRTLLVAHSNQALNQLFQKIAALDIDERHLLRLGHGEGELDTDTNFSKAGRVESFLERGSYYLAEVQRLAASIDAPGAHGNSCETAEYFEQVWVQPRWKRYWESLRADEAGADVVVDAFPFHAYFSTAPQPLFPPQASPDELLEIAKGCERHITRLFAELADIRPFEILRAQRDKANYLLVKEARIIAMTSTHAAIRRQEIASLGFRYDTLVMEEAAQITEIEAFLPLVLQNPHPEGKTGGPVSPLQRIVLVGDHLQNSPVIQTPALSSHSNLAQSLFQRLIRLGTPHTLLNAQGRSRPSLAHLYAWRYPSLTSLPLTTALPAFQRANAGFRHEYQFLDVPAYKGSGETSPAPHTLQNLGEAEYAVALYQYMRLLGYPAAKISILTAYAGQRALIKDVLEHRCRGNGLFGLPGWCGTVDKYQGEQNDYVILSLVRTTGVGFWRDLRRVTVALSRARLGLYVLGRRGVFEGSLELGGAFAGLLARRGKLELVLNELWPAERGVGEAVVGEGRVAVMEGVEHLGRYVFEMTRAKVESLKRGGVVVGGAGESESEDEGGGMVDEDEEMGAGEDEVDQGGK